MNKGIFVAPCFCHSKKPSATTRHRRLLNASLKAGLTVSVSARALMCLLAIFGSVAQKGTRPHRMATSCFTPLFKTTATLSVGATLKLGWRSSVISWTPKSLAIADEDLFLTNRPHMTFAAYTNAVHAVKQRRVFASFNRVESTARRWLDRALDALEFHAVRA